MGLVLYQPTSGPECSWWVWGGGNGGRGCEWGGELELLLDRIFCSDSVLFWQRRPRIGTATLPPSQCGHSLLCFGGYFQIVDLYYTILTLLRQTSKRIEGRRRSRPSIFSVVRDNRSLPMTIHFVYSYKFRKILELYTNYTSLCKRRLSLGYLRKTRKTKLNVLNLLRIVVSAHGWGK